MPRTARDRGSGARLTLTGRCRAAVRSPMLTARAGPAALGGSRWRKPSRQALAPDLTRSDRRPTKGRCAVAETETTRRSAGELRRILVPLALAQFICSFAG